MPVGNSALSPIGGEFVINRATDGAQGLVALAPLVTADGFIAVDESNASGFGSAAFSGIVGQVFDAAGGKVGAEFQISTSHVPDLRKPDITPLANNGFPVVWAPATAPAPACLASALTKSLDHADRRR